MARTSGGIATRQYAEQCTANLEYRRTTNLTQNLGTNVSKLRLFISEDKQLGISYFTTSISLPKLSTTSYLTFSGA